MPPGWIDWAYRGMITIFLHMGPFFVCCFLSTHWDSHTLSLWKVHAAYVFVASIHPSRTWMSGSVEPMWWNACVRRLDVSLYTHPKELYGLESQPMLTPRKKIPSTRRLWGGSNLCCCITQDKKPNTLPTDLFWPGQWSLICCACGRHITTRPL